MSQSKSGKMTKVYHLVQPTPSGTSEVFDSQDMTGGIAFSSQSWYQRLVQGSSTRLARYREYDNMDEDIEVSRALDTIAEEMTPKTDAMDLPLEIVYKSTSENLSTSTNQILRSALEHWCKIQELDTRMFYIARNTIKFGDCFFRKRHKDRASSKKWEFIHPKNVVSAVVDQNDVTKIIAWQIRVDNKQVNSNYGNMVSSLGSSEEVATEFVPADEIIQMTLLDEMSEQAPFGKSVLLPVYRTFKQLQMLQDSIVIYRITRAPERRVFNLDVGGMNPARQKTYLEQFKNEVNQKKIPRKGSAGNQVESIYDPQSIQEDFFFAVKPDGRGTRIDTLPGGTGLGDMQEVEHFMGKLYRGLRVPTSYMNINPSSAQNPIFNDGASGQSFVEEFQFAKWCLRLQPGLSSRFDAEFKRFVQAIGVKIDPGAYSIRIPIPKNFELYRRQESDRARMDNLSTALGIEPLSKRYAMSRFGQLSQDEIRENERLKAQEMGVDPNDPDYMKIIYGDPSNAEEGFGPGGAGGGLGDLGAEDLGGDMAAGDEDIEGMDLGGEDLGGEDMGEQPPQ